MNIYNEYSSKNQIINSIILLSGRFILSSSREERIHANRNLEIWKNTNKKHEIGDYFNSPLFGAVYIQNFYKRRIEIFIRGLRLISRDNDAIQSDLINSQSIVSFGCGAGPEIVAYIHYIRNKLNVRGNVLNFRAVDTLNYWENYIKEIHDNADNFTFVNFEEGNLNEEYLETMENCDVCIMSFPQGMNFTDVWHLLKLKFNLIILIDLLSNTLSKYLIRNGFQRRNINGIGIYTFVKQRYLINQSPTDSYESDSILTSCYDSDFEF